MPKPTKPDCERAIRSLIGKWQREIGVVQGKEVDTDFLDFKEWAESKGYGHYFEFVSRMGPLYDAEMWFDEETNQVWKR